MPACEPRVEKREGVRGREGVREGGKERVEAHLDVDELAAFHLEEAAHGTRLEARVVDLHGGALQGRVAFVSRIALQG